MIMGPVMVVCSRLSVVPGLRRRVTTHGGVALFVLALFALLLAPPALADDRQKLLVLGDSLSAAYGFDQDQGWVALLQQRIDAKALPWRVINASLSGETTGGGLARLPQLLERHEPDLVLIELGGNDGLRGYPLDQIADNLLHMARKSQDAGAAVILAGIEMPPNYNPRNQTALRDLYRNVATELDVPLIPFLLEDVALDSSLMQNDGIHPTAEAQPAVLDNAWAVIGDLLKREIEGQNRS